MDQKYEEIKTIEKNIKDRLSRVEYVYQELYKKNLELVKRVEELEEIKCPNLIIVDGKRIVKCEYLSKK